MHQRTDLANGLVNGSDRLLVELIQPTDTPAFIAVTWQQNQPLPHQPTTRL
jgi:hypothetical protein